MSGRKPVADSSSKPASARMAGFVAFDECVVSPAWRLSFDQLNALIMM